EIPADEVRVAAVVRIAEGALQGVVEHQREERGGTAREAGGGSRLDFSEERILVGCAHRSERLPARGVRVTIERGEAGRVGRSGRRQRAAERAIDVVRGARL